MELDICCPKECSLETFYSISKQIKIIEKYGLIKESLIVFNYDDSWIASKSILTFFNFEYPTQLENEVHSTIKHNTLYVTKTHVKYVLKTLYGEKYPEYFI